MGTIIVVENLFEPQEATRHEWDGPYIDWLQVHYPSGFQQKHYTYFGNSLLAVENYDRVIGEDDRIVLVFTPGAPAIAAAGAYLASLSIGTILATAAISAAVSLALNFVFSKLFPTKNPAADATSASVPAAGSTYSLSIPTNRIRLGEPIPVIYGDVLWAPDICSYPYGRFINNDHYVYILLCLGQGLFSDIALQIADTPVAQMPPGIVEYKIHGPSDHNLRLNSIETAWGAKGFMENVDTSVEVADQELIAGVEESYILTVGPGGVATSAIGFGPLVVPGAIVKVEIARLNSGDRTIVNVQFNNRITVNPAYITGWILPPTPVTPQITKSGMTLRVTWSSSTVVPTAAEFQSSNPGVVYTDTIKFTINNVSYTVLGEITGGYGTRDVMFNVTDWGGADSVLNPDVVTNVSALELEFEAQKELTASISIATAQIIGPFVVSRPGTAVRSVELDLQFPGGLYGIDETSGNLIWATCTLAYKLDMIDDNGVVTVPGLWYEFSYSGISNTPRRETLLLYPASGRYRVQVKRVSPKSNKVADKSDVLWTGLRGVLVNDPNQVVYGDTTLISVVIKATNGLASDATNRIGVRCRRLINGANTSNPADFLPDILTNTIYGAGRPATEVDTVANADLRAWANGKNGFNGVFDQATNVWSAMQAVTTPVQANPVTYGAQVSSVIDRPLGTHKFLFSENNIVKSTMEYGWQFVEIDGPDGFEVEYRRTIDWVADYVTHPAAAINPEKVVLFGCTDATTALAHAKYLWQRKLYRRKYCSFSTELEGHLPQLGDKIRVTHVLGGTEDYVVGSIESQDKFRFKIEAYKYAPEVFT